MDLYRLFFHHFKENVVWDIMQPATANKNMPDQALYWNINGIEWFQIPLPPRRFLSFVWFGFVANQQRPANE